jgi:hypothetical protein
MIAARSLLFGPGIKAFNGPAIGKCGLDSGSEKSLFRAKISIHKDGGHASRLSDFPNAHGVIASVRERGQGRLQDGLANGHRVSPPPLGLIDARSSLTAIHDSINSFRVPLKLKRRLSRTRFVQAHDSHHGS